MTKKSLSLINYPGHKTSLLDLIQKNLPKNQINKFYDVFSGSCVVGLNIQKTNIKEVVFVDNNEYLNLLYQSVTDNNFINVLENLIDRYNLTNSSRKSRSEYLKDPNIGTVTWHGKKVSNFHLDQLNKKGYLKLLEDFNNKKFQGLEIPCAYMIASIYGRNSYVTCKGQKLSGGVGPLDFSKKTKSKLLLHSDLISKFKYSWINDTFQNINPDSDDFVYMDPPYLASSYKYSGWTEEDEKNLLEWIDGLKCKWMLSNVLFSGKKSNVMLIDWSKKYNVVNCTKEYRKWAVKGKMTAKRKVKDIQEVLIKNY